MFFHIAWLELGAFSFLPWFSALCGVFPTTITTTTATVAQKAERPGPKILFYLHQGFYLKWSTPLLHVLQRILPAAVISG